MTICKQSVELTAVDDGPRKILTHGEDEPDTAKDDNNGPPDFTKALIAASDYFFEKQELEITFTSHVHGWKLVSLAICYDFTGRTKTVDAEKEAPSVSAGQVHTFQVNLTEFERHCLQGEFTIEIKFVYIEDKDEKLRSAKYKANVPYFEKSTPLKFIFLGQFHSDQTIANLFNAEFKDGSLSSLNDRALLLTLGRYKTELSLQGKIDDPDDAIKMITYALRIEDLASQLQLEKYDLKNVNLKVEKAKKKRISFCSFFVYHKQLPPNFKEETSLCIVRMNSYVEGKVYSGNEAVFVSIDSFDHCHLRFRSYPSNCFSDFDSDDGYDYSGDELQEGLKYLVRFIPNRSTYRAGYQALAALKQKNLQTYFTNFEHEQEVIEASAIVNFEWFNKQIEANEEQKLAIKNIVNCTAFPLPYVVFGPPGTGKSSLIVEAIAQILKLKPDSRILVTAQSNSACDEVGVRLLKYVPISKILRLYSPSLKHSKICNQLKCISNLRDNRKMRSEEQGPDPYPTIEEYKHFNVVISTLMGSSRLTLIESVRISTFDYIFVDECAAASMPEALVPIVGLGTSEDLEDSEDAITANIVILGDHKQLGPVINSEMASQLGLGLSLMERIMKTPRYSIDPVTKVYDNNYVTQLLDNFRSHPAILQFSNVMFYDSKLRAKLQEPERSFGAKWERLPNKKLPMLFDCVKTPSQTAKDDTSSYNEGEVKRVRFYVDLLLERGVHGEKVAQADIGIVSPYKAQLKKLAKEFEYAAGIEIGTSEYYQGREKKIIIISTVKSGGGVGFLKNEKRLNVCITRAKSLLILVGNADTLQQSPLWNSLLHFLKANNACCGEGFGLVTMTDQEKKLQEKLNAILVDPEAFEKSAEEEKAQQEKAVAAMRDRLAKLEELMREL